ncbi:hypothetical protein C8A05DRAFT_47337 [Staphylotrichum tortipilum]|uniref:RNA polymerase II subunit B1 CTD phosphatase RPAP2 homolog n=1 Tax=Staphylotrichum tortipilum TaxID=2831512 RepID=A0AAN6MD72_9PEZI|nr:hypothetical protein C8A05DRAFT_47337 [Staphylotrichum longicolle]
MATTTTPAAPPKGILKKTTHHPSPSPSSPIPPTQELTRPELLAQQETAARLRLLQKLRSTELKAAIAPETFELLCSLPQHPTALGASSPSPAEVSLFLTTLRDFQPAEYLDLIEERNCLSKCGYTLCPRPRRTHDGPFKITSWKSTPSASGGSIARTADLNKWCSDACALRALHLKVQLDNPSFERDPVTGKMVVKLELREEPNTATKNTSTQQKAAAKGLRGTEEDRTSLAQAMAQLELDRQQQQKQPQKKKTNPLTSTLAAERGDPSAGVFNGVSRVEVTIREKPIDQPVQAPDQLEGDAQLLVEGYKPTFRGGSKKSAEEAGNEEGAASDDDDEFFTVRF